MKVTSPADFSFVTPLARPVEKDETVEVDDELGAQLLAQGWKPAGKSVLPKPTQVANDVPARDADAVEIKE
jgi:hypothetical protein